MELIPTDVTARQGISTCPDACMSGEMVIGTSRSPSYRTALPSFLNHQAMGKKVPNSICGVHALRTWKCLGKINMLIL